MKFKSVVAVLFFSNICGISNGAPGGQRKLDENVDRISEGYASDVHFGPSVYEEEISKCEVCGSDGKTSNNSHNQELVVGSLDVGFSSTVHLGAKVHKGASDLCQKCIQNIISTNSKTSHYYSDHPKMYVDTVSLGYNSNVQFGPIIYEGTPGICRICGFKIETGRNEISDYSDEEEQQVGTSTTKDKVPLLADGSSQEVVGSSSQKKPDTKFECHIMK